MELISENAEVNEPIFQMVTSYFYVFLLYKLTLSMETLNGFHDSAYTSFVIHSLEVIRVSQIP